MKELHRISSRGVYNNSIPQSSSHISMKCTGFFILKSNFMQLCKCYVNVQATYIQEVK